MSPGTERLLHHPMVARNDRFAETADGQRHDDGRGAMPTLGGSAVDQSLHEGTQAGDVERAVFEVVGDVVRPRLRQLPTFVVTAAIDLGVVDGLPFSEK